MIFGNDLDDYLNSSDVHNGDRSIMTAQIGQRQKMTRLLIKQKMGKDNLKCDILPPPPLGKSTGHGLITGEYNFS